MLFLFKKILQCNNISMFFIQSKITEIGLKLNSIFFTFGSLLIFVLQVSMAVPILNTVYVSIVYIFKMFYSIVRDELIYLKLYLVL